MRLSPSIHLRHTVRAVGFFLLPALCLAQQPARRSKAPKLPNSGLTRWVITGAEIREQNLESLDQLFHGEAPDIFAASAPTRSVTTLRSRGFATALPRATPRVYLNGVELESPGSIREIAPDIVDSIVVRPGAVAGALEGIGADGGVIYVYTQRGSDSTRVTSVGKYSGGFDRSLYGEQKSHRFDDEVGAVTGGREGTTYYIAVGHSSEGDWAPGYKSRVRHGIASVSSTGTLGTVSGFWRYHRDTGSPDDFFAQPIGAVTDTGPRTDSASYTTYGGTADLKLAQYWTAHVSGGFSQAIYGESALGFGASTALDTLRYRSHARVRRTSLDARTTLHFPATNGWNASVTAGVNQATTIDEASSARSISQAADTSFVSVSRQRTDAFRRGYFGLASLRFRDIFVMNAGARRDDKIGFGDVANDKWRPRADAAFLTPLPMGTLTVRGGVGSVLVTSLLPIVYTVPSADGTGFMPAIGALSVTDLHAAEAGADFAGTFGAAGFTVYDQRNTGGQMTIPSAVPTVEVTPGGVRNRGVSGYARGEYKGWSARASYSTVQTRRDGVLLVNGGSGTPSAVEFEDATAAPTAYGHGTVMYHDEKIRLRYDVGYTGSHHNIDIVNPVLGGRTYPAFFLHDVNASVPFGKDAWIIGYAHNVANAEEYDQYTGMYVRGRRLGFGVRWGSE